MNRRALIAVILLCQLWGAPLSARTNVNTLRFKPAVNGVGLALTESGQLLGHLQLNAALLTNYAWHPVMTFGRSRGLNYDQLFVDHRLKSNVLFALGLYGWVEIALDLPVMLYQTGRSLYDGSALEHSGIGDVRLVLKSKILRTTRLAFSAQVDVTAPSAKSRNTLGEHHVSVTPGLNLSLHNLFGVPLGFFTNLGVTIRGVAQVEGQRIHHTLDWRLGISYTFAKVDLDLFGEGYASFALMRSPGPYLNNLPAESYLGLRWRHSSGFQLTVGGGGGWNTVARGLGSPALRFFVGLGFTTAKGDADGDGIVDSKDRCPNEPEDKDGFQDHDGCPDPDNDGDGVPDKEDKCPNVKGLKSNHGCPEPDSDGDGVPDNLDKCPKVKGLKSNHGCPDDDFDKDGIPNGKDKCPHEPEDFDGYQDHDGCPDPDNDNDKICDPWVAKTGQQKKYAHICKGSDKCPNQPETYNGFQDDDGCPDQVVRLTKDKIEIGLHVQFEIRSAKLKAASSPLLAKIAKIIKDHPELLLIQIEGHTDRQGGRAYNKRLSQRRAESVRKHLIATHKISPKRLKARGFGPDKPIAKGFGPEVWAKNRRVEFSILTRKKR